MTIVTNIGFMPAPYVSTRDPINLVASRSGAVKEEFNIDRILYQGLKFRHRTFEITADETATLLKKVNTDQHKKAKSYLKTTDHQYKLSSSFTNAEKEAALVSERKEVGHGGPDYHLWRFNCKTYAMSVFKHLGISEAKSLANKGLQIPWTRNNLMTVLGKNSFICPERDEVMQAQSQSILSIDSATSKIKEHLSSGCFSLNLMPEHSSLLYKKLTRPEKMGITLDAVIERCSELQFHMRRHLSTATKRQKDQASENRSELFFLIAKELTMLLPYIQSNDEDKERETKFIDSFSELCDQISEYHKLQPAIEKLSERSRSGSLEYQWKDEPKVTIRNVPASLSELDINLQATLNMSSDADDGYSELTDLLLTMALGTDDNKLTCDLNRIRTEMTAPALAQVKESSIAFEQSVSEIELSSSEKASEQINDACRRQQDLLNSEAEELIEKSAGFTGESTGREIPVVLDSITSLATHLMQPISGDTQAARQDGLDSAKKKPSQR